jgi:hypothetical protein
MLFIVFGWGSRAFIPYVFDDVQEELSFVFVLCMDVLTDQPKPNLNVSL